MGEISLKSLPNLRKREESSLWMLHEWRSFYFQFKIFFLKSAILHCWKDEPILIFFLSHLFFYLTFFFSSEKENIPNFMLAPSICSFVPYILILWVKPFEHACASCHEMVLIFHYDKFILSLSMESGPPCYTLSCHPYSCSYESIMSCPLYSPHFIAPLRLNHHNWIWTSRLVTRKKWNITRQPFMQTIEDTTLIHLSQM